MSTQSGFLNSFLKFIQGEKGEKLPNASQRGRPAFSHVISMTERTAILTSSKRLNQEMRKTLVSKVEKPMRKRGRPRLRVNQATTRTSVSGKGDTSDIDSQEEEESGRDTGSDLKVDNDQRLLEEGGNAEIEMECDPGKEKPEEVEIRDKGSGPAIVDVPQGSGSLGESDQVLMDSGKNSGGTEILNREEVAPENAQSAKCSTGESSVMLNGEGSNAAERKEKADPPSEDNPQVTEKKRGRKRKSDKAKDGVPQRKMSSRRAKQKVHVSYAESDDDTLPGLDNSDSDDPVWMPDEKKGSSDEGSGFSWSRFDKLRTKSKKSLSSPTVTGPSKVRGGVAKESVEHTKPRPTELTPKESEGGGAAGASTSTATSAKETQVGEMKEDKPNITTQVNSQAPNENVKNPNVAAANTVTETRQTGVFHPLNPIMKEMPFQSGTFIGLKSDLEDTETHPIWRVDGKSLLQKYEPFRSESGSIWYRNISTYSGWGPKSNMKYKEIPIKFIKQNKVETIVEIIQADLPISEDKLCEKLFKEYAEHEYAYEVFVQTLVSQALDSNFLSEIIAENDAYFLDCLKKMDEICMEKKTKLMQAHQWPRKLTECLRTWPGMIISPKESNKQYFCSLCYSHEAENDVKMGGNPYKSTTLEYEVPSKESFNLKDLQVCARCTDILVIFHKISHLKYHTYEKGVKMVSERKALHPNKNNTDILHDILAEIPRVKQEFREIGMMWARADINSRRLKITKQNTNKSDE